jgi:putative membrane protein
MNTLIKLTLRTFFIAFVLVLNTNCSNKNNEPSESKDRAEEANAEKFDNKGEKDADRVVDIYSGNMYEIKVSEDAGIKATTAEVKKIAAMMVEAHTKMKKDMVDLAAKKVISLPEAITDEQQRKMDKLGEKTGFDYDEEYVEQMKNAHDDVIKQLERLADNAEDPEVKTWAANGLPEVRAQIDMLKAADENLDSKRKDKNTWNNKSDLHDGKDDIHRDKKTSQK